MSAGSGEEALRWLSSKEVIREVNLAALVAEHSSLLYRVAFSIVRSPSEAEDIVQDTFLRALQHKGTLTRVTSIKAWLVRVTLNLGVDRRRRVSPDQLDAALAETITSEQRPHDEQIFDAAELKRVLRAVDGLPKLEKAVLVLAAFEELSVTEIAAILGKSQSSVRSLTFRARAHLQQRLRQQDRDITDKTRERRL